MKWGLFPVFFVVITIQLEIFFEIFGRGIPVFYAVLLLLSINMFCFF